MDGQVTLDGGGIVAVDRGHVAGGKYKHNETKEEKKPSFACISGHFRHLPPKS